MMLSFALTPKAMTCAVIVALTTSYSSTSGDSEDIVNQVADLYNTFNELTDQYQSVSGAVTEGTPDVHYSFSTDFRHAPRVRPASHLPQRPRSRLWLQLGH